MQELPTYAILIRRLLRPNLQTQFHLTSFISRQSCMWLTHDGTRPQSHTHQLQPDERGLATWWQRMTSATLCAAGWRLTSKKGKGFPYSTPSVGPRADPGVQAVSLRVTVSHPPGGRLPLLSARPAVTSPAAEHHRPLAGTKLYCLVTEAHRCKQLA